MRFLHTSDWHVGKTIRGHARIDEHRAVLGEIVDVAGRESVDVVLVVGDLFESAAPAPDARALVYETLLALRATGADVLVLAGNHDHAAEFEALRPVFGAAGVTVLGNLARPDAGGVVEIERNGERARVALLPFISQRHLVRVEQLLALDAAQAAGHYAERVRAIVGALCGGSSIPDTIGVLAAHCFVRGGRLGGGERDAQTVYDYGIEAVAFPSHLHYVALGHLHRQQSFPAGAPAWYSGSPIAVDFGEEDDRKGLLLIDAAPSTPAKVTPVELTTPVRLRTLTGTLDELREMQGTTADAWLRVRVVGQAHAGLADHVREWFPRAVDVQMVRDDDARGSSRDHEPTRRGRSPQDLFAGFLAHEQIADTRLTQLFDELHDEVVDATRGGG